MPETGVYKEWIESSLTLRHKMLTSSPCNAVKRLSIYNDTHGMACLKVYFGVQINIDQLT
jgi:hypothetical protein